MNRIKVKKQYSESYLKYGFSAIDDMPQCSVYYKVLCIANMKS